MNFRRNISTLVWLLVAVQSANLVYGADLQEVKDGFLNPPKTARPWVYWMWLSSNVTPEGITADLEAMDRVGIGGVMLLDVDNGTPPGPMKYMDEQWQKSVAHVVREAKRLGMEVTVNNGPGYYGSGGPWVSPGKAMQTVLASETQITGGKEWGGKLPKPPARNGGGPSWSGDRTGRANGDEYRDIAVFAIPEPHMPADKRYKIYEYDMKALRWWHWINYKGGQSAPLDKTAPPGVSIPLDKIVDLTGRVEKDGSLRWDAPPGEWTILRVGHAWSGAVVGPSPAGQAGPETDKLDKEATRLHFDAMVKKLNEAVGPARKGTLVATHVDSWEGGGQNWTAAMPAEFKKRRGYDLRPYLPALAGRVVGDLQTTERFLFDLRQTVSELMVENYVAEFHRLARQNDLRFTFESYTTIGNDLDAANHTDEPMAEFWTGDGNGGLGFNYTTKSMSSAAHLNGRKVVAAESFTANDKERWLWHPAMLKTYGDEAFARGVNRLVFHRYAAQRFLNRYPGLQMGPWGQHYERTNTWWEYSLPWHTYIARCQYLLRQGEPLADVLVLQSEEPLLRFQTIPMKGYDYDVCGPDTFKSATIKDGRFTFEKGPAYRLLLLNHTGTMTVPMLRRIRDHVLAGGAVLGKRPLATPGLTDYPRADAELKRLADEIWGEGKPEAQRKVGRGTVFSDIPVEDALSRLGVVPDLSSDQPLNWNHRSVEGADVYFVANPTDKPVVANCTFRVHDKAVTLWNAETGDVRPSGASTSEAGTQLSIPLGPTESTFVVFNQGKTNDRLVTAIRDGEHSTPTAVTGPWTVRFQKGWGGPDQIELDQLGSWSDHKEDGVKYFSGTGTYTKSLSIPPELLAKDRRLWLDLGKVAVMARVTLNGKELGILWKPPYRIDVTESAKPGDNLLEVAVVNLWPNRLIGDEQLPEDSERNLDRSRSPTTLKEWPKWLLDGRPSPTGRLTFSSWRLWKKDDSLQESGLLGPVTLRATAIVPSATPER